MKRQRLKDKRRLIIGVTGSFGSGKTTVSRMFKEYGAQVIDADAIARKLIFPKGSAYKKVVGIFGKRILKKDRYINRAKLAKIVFNDKLSLEKLNKAVHPAAIKTIKAKIKASGRRYIILDAPLLIETGLEKLTDKIIVVQAGRDIQVKRVLSKTPLGKKDILKRISAQMPLNKKASLADFVIDNNKTIGEVKTQVEKIMRKLQD